MSCVGVYCSIEVQSSRGRVIPLDDVYLSEDVQGGSSLWLRVDKETASSFRLGDRVDLRVEPNGGESGQPGSLHLWCNSIAIERDGAGEYATIEATDPLGFCFGDSEFRTHAGNVSLFQLLDVVLSRQAGKLEGLPKTSASSPTVPLEWLFQCNESGADFIHRIAWTAGYRVFWNRERFDAAAIGSGRGSGSTVIELDFSRDLVRMISSVGVDLPDRRVFWIDPATRTTQPLRYASDPSGDSMAEQELSGRATGNNRPLLPAHLGADLSPTRGTTLVAETIRADVGVGDPVRVAGGDTFLVTRIEHRIHTTGSYSNRIVCLPRSLWGVGTAQRSVGLGGLFQGEVTHNADPLDLGRIRVALSEDIERRPSPWIPFVPAYAGRGTGLHWIPEVGDLVMVVAESATPECLYCIGSIRGNDQKIEQSWRSEGNSVKTFAARNNTVIMIDDQKEIIRLQTGDSYLELRGNGEIRLNGKKVDVQAESKASLTAGQNLKIDAARVDIG